MNKENNKSAAGLRRSAVVERLRLREEWSELKGIDCQQEIRNQKTNILTKQQTNVKGNATKKVPSVHRTKESTRNMHLTNDTLRGIVALVEVGSESRALPLRAALSALGASVLPSWSPLVTHLIWTQGGCRSTRAKARALACRLVSPLWVEACAASSRRLPEQAFPAAARASDLPSPKTLRQLLKKAEMENIPITDLLTDSSDESKLMPRLRMSSETERDTSADLTTDTSRDTSHDTSLDNTKNTTHIESRVNTAPRRAMPKTPSISPDRPTKSRRKLFTHKEAELSKGSDDPDETTDIPKPIKPSFKSQTKYKTMKASPRPGKKVKQTKTKELVQAERIARKILVSCTAATQSSTAGYRPRIVLSGMAGAERRSVTEAIKSLKGRIQSQVDRRTTHVLLGSCTREDENNHTAVTGTQNTSNPVITQLQKPRTVSALCGAARGCLVLHASWALDCRKHNKWLHHTGYEVLHLKKMSQRARVERSALGRAGAQYAYDVFCGMRVRVLPAAHHGGAAGLLLALCGAALVGGQQNDSRTQNGVLTQNTQTNTSECDITIGKDNGEVSSKWVFDSVAAGRMRTTRKYIVNSLSQSDLVAQMQSFQC